MKIGILNYGVGNIGSVESALDFLKADKLVITELRQLKQVSSLIVAGVGHYKHAMELLSKSGFSDGLSEFALIQKKPILGICLGMQLFATTSQESGESIKGLNWIPGNVLKLNGKEKVPHMGWSKLNNVRGPLFRGVLNGPFYFMHSYHYSLENHNYISASALHGDLNFTASVNKENIFGVQFHPEKSQGEGVRLLFNFIEIANGF